MLERDIELELLTEENFAQVRAIRREDVSEAFVDTADTIMELTRYGVEHGCLGHTYAIKFRGVYVGLILLGEALPWETDPDEMRREPFYRLMGFVIDNRYRGQGIGGYALEKVIELCYRDFGVRPIALGCHRENHQAAAFYQRHGFRQTDAMEHHDVYYLRYPQG